MTTDRKIRIAIDGPGGAGKSSVAKEIAKRRGLRYVDTGALYRSVGLYVADHGIGENDDSIRERICSEMEFLGLKIDTELNKNASRNEAVFSAPDSKVLAMVLPTNEEIMIARDTLEVAGLN